MSNLIKESTGSLFSIKRLSEDYTGDYKNMWSILLNYLNNEKEKIGHDGLRQTDINPDSIWETIDANADFSDDFFKDIYSDIALSLKSAWHTTIKDDATLRSNSLWNESVEEILCYMYKHLDPEGVEEYENSGYLIENDDGTINTDYLKAAIPIKGGVGMRVQDVKFADAGFSFVKESDIYEAKELETTPATYAADGTLIKEAVITLFTRIVVNPWVVPWYNINGSTYSTVRGSDKIIGVLSNDSDLQFTRNKSDETITTEEEYFLWPDLNGDGVLTTTKATSVKDLLEGEDHDNDAYWYCLFYARLAVDKNLTREAAYESILADLKSEGKIRQWQLNVANRYFDGDTENLEANWRLIFEMDIRNEEGNLPTSEDMFNLIADFCAQAYSDLYSTQNNMYSWKDFVEKHGYTCTIYTRKKEKKIPHYIRLIMPKYKRRVEIEDLNRNFWVIGQVVTAISAYLFDEDSPLQKMLTNLLNEVMQLWENVLYLWAAAAAVSADPVYTKVHTEVVYLTNSELQSYTKFDYFNFSYNNSYEDLIKKKMQYLIQTHTDSNLVVIPVIRSNNYEHNYYSKETYPFILCFNRNNGDTDYTISYLQDDELPVVVDIESDEIASQIYAIKENEDTYDYIVPLSEVKNLYDDDKNRYYGLLRTKVNFAQAPFINDDGQIEWDGLTIMIIDAGKYLLETGNTGITQQRIYALNKVYNDIDFGISSTKQAHDIEIKKGYYQGELLSTPRTTKAYDYNIDFGSIYLIPIDKDVEEITLSDYKATDNKILQIYTQDQETIRNGTIKFILKTGVHDCSLWGGGAYSTSYWKLNSDNKTIAKVETDSNFQSRHSAFVKTVANLFNPRTNKWITYADYNFYTSIPKDLIYTGHKDGEDLYIGYTPSNNFCYTNGEKMKADNWYIKYIETNGSRGVKEAYKAYKANYKGDNVEYWNNAPDGYEEDSIIQRIKVHIFCSNGTYCSKEIERSASDLSKWTTKSSVNLELYNSLINKFNTTFTLQGNKSTLSADNRDFEKYHNDGYSY